MLKKKNYKVKYFPTYFQKNLHYLRLEDVIRLKKFNSFGLEKI